MTDERKPPPRFRKPSDLRDDEVVYIPPAPDTERSAPRKIPPGFKDAVRAETTRDVLELQRKMALQLDGFGQAMNRRFDLFHEELALQRADLAVVRDIVTGNHAPRLDKVETTMGQKVAKGGGIVGIVIVALPLLAEVLPKWASVFEKIGEYLR